MKFVFKLILGCFLFLLLIGRNLPFENLYISGLGPWDLFAMCLFPFLDYKIIPKKILIYLFVFFMSATIGMLFSIHIGIRINDIFEILRLFYSFELIALGVLFGKYLNNNNIIDVLFFSSACVFVFAYLNPMNPDVLGFVQIWNPNVIGNYFTHCIILILVLSEKLNKKIIIFCLLLSVFSFFTYSKASWILIFLIFISIFININKFQKFIFLIVFVLLIKYNIESISAINTLINAKIDASGFDGSAASGSSVGARVGLAYSGLLMFLENPIFGIGIGNFEIVNDTLKSTLGNMYYKDDNANSLFFHYLGTTGILGLSAVMLLIFEYFKLLTSSAKSKSIYLLMLIFVLISINFQREIFTTNTMYLLMGVLIYKFKKIEKNNYFKSIN
ncbi:MAG: O-antigen ligase family protein [Polaribacter sp.]|nr:O-antigen ligase family protein [Polaribacter sp.]